MAKEIINCVCMTCGVRNDHSTDNGYCRNGHDNWLEYYDVVNKNEFFKDTCIAFKMTEEELTEKFMNNNIKNLKKMNGVSVVWGIRAENRETKERVMITEPMTISEAQSWKPTSLHKKRYRYFRVCRYRGKYEG